MLQVKERFDVLEAVLAPGEEYNGEEVDEIITGTDLTSANLIAKKLTAEGRKVGIIQSKPYQTKVKCMACGKSWTKTFYGNVDEAHYLFGEAKHNCPQSVGTAILSIDRV